MTTLRAVTFDFWNTLYLPAPDGLRARARRLAGWMRADDDAVHAALIEHFEPAALVFSDEVGVYKPDPRIFQAALGALGAEPSEAAHVGDLRFTDVAGARAVGMRAIRFSGGRDDEADGPEADVVI